MLSSVAIGHTWTVTQRGKEGRGRRGGEKAHLLRAAGAGRPGAAKSAAPCVCAAGSNRQSRGPRPEGKRAAAAARRRERGPKERDRPARKRASRGTEGKRSAARGRGPEETSERRRAPAAAGPTDLSGQAGGEDVCRLRGGGAPRRRRPSAAAGRRRPAPATVSACAWSARGAPTSLQGARLPPARKGGEGVSGRDFRARRKPARERENGGAPSAGGAGGVEPGPRAVRLEAERGARDLRAQTGRRFERRLGERQTPGRGRGPGLTACGPARGACQRRRAVGGGSDSHPRCGSTGCNMFHIT